MQQSWVSLGNVEAVQFPDDGPGQFDVGKWVEARGGNLGLYDGAIQSPVNTSTDANWRWGCATLNNANKGVSVGDWIICVSYGHFIAVKDLSELSLKRAKK